LFYAITISSEKNYTSEKMPTAIFIRVHLIWRSWFGLGLELDVTLRIRDGNRI